MKLECPCGSLQPYKTCCQPLHNNQQLAATAKQLMMSRYAAFATHEIDYLINTHSKQTRATIIRSDIENWAKACQWLGLEVLTHKQLERSAEVEFVAWYKEAGKLQCLHDLSHFTLEPIDDQHTGNNQQPAVHETWYYHSSATPTNKVQPPQRNDRCVCGSGKKFKKCCGC
jgi:SEC-C motif-containing protein